MRVFSRANPLSGKLDEAASKDKAIASLGVLVFWPALFALGGTKEQEAELAKLKGQSEALQVSMSQKNEDRALEVI